MDCNDFEMEIGSFISGKMDLSEEKSFILHLDSCTDCFDELGIYYIVQTALGKVDRDEVQSYNFQGELETIISDRKKQIRQAETRQKVVNAITNTANLVVLAALAIAFLRWFNILL